MLSSWLTFTAFLTIPACPGRGATGRGTLTVAPTCRVKGHPEVELTLNCGDGKDLGVVQHWHTPFGDLQTPSVHSKLDPVFMHHDGSLVVPNTSVLHSGLYYCLLQHTEGTTLWPYELRVGQKLQDNGEHQQSRGCAAFRLRRAAGSEEESQAGVSGELFAGAVAASVLLTFVLGFSAGALSRTHVLRCLGAVRAKLQSPKRRRRCQTDTPDHDPEVSMTTLPPMYENPASENDSATNVSPPAKPQRSFRHKREQEEQPETPAYLEGCDYMKKEEKAKEKEGERRCAEEINKDNEKEIEEEEEREFGRLYLIGEDGESQSETDEDEEEKMEDLVQEKEEEVAGEERSKDKDGGRETSGDSEELSTETEDETGGNNQEVTNESPSTSAPRPARRVIRLYQYDEDGQRYSHLPDPALDAPLPAPRLKQRSVSLTRLSAIMAAASAGPLDERETKREESEEKPHD